MEIYIKCREFLISSCSRVTSLFRRKNSGKAQVPPIQMAMLSGSIRRVK
jgi:hypothetical protein